MTGTTWNSWAFAHLFPKLEPQTKMDKKWRQALSYYKKQPRGLTNEPRNYPLFTKEKETSSNRLQRAKIFCNITSIVHSDNDFLSLRGSITF